MSLNIPLVKSYKRSRFPASTALAARIADLEPPTACGVLLFDRDGTLVDSTDVNFAAFAAALGARGFELDREWFLARTGMSTTEMLGELVEVSGPDIEPEGFRRDRDAIYLSLLHHVAAIGPTRRFAERNLGKRKLAVVTGSGRSTFVPTANALGYDRSFDVVVTREYAPRAKPAPDLYLRALELLAVDGRKAAAYEDSDEGLEAASLAGIRYLFDVRPISRRRV